MYSFVSHIAMWRLVDTLRWILGREKREGKRESPPMMDNEDRLCGIRMAHICDFVRERSAGPHHYRHVKLELSTRFCRDVLKYEADRPWFGGDLRELYGISRTSNPKDDPFDTAWIHDSEVTHLPHFHGLNDEGATLQRYWDLKSTSMREIGYCVVPLADMMRLRGETPCSLCRSRPHNVVSAIYPRDLGCLCVLPVRGVEPRGTLVVYRDWGRSWSNPLARWRNTAIPVNMVCLENIDVRQWLCFMCLDPSVKIELDRTDWDAGCCVTHKYGAIYPVRRNCAMATLVSDRNVEHTTTCTNCGEIHCDAARWAAPRAAAIAAKRARRTKWDTRRALLLMREARSDPYGVAKPLATRLVWTRQVGQRPRRR